MTEYLPLSVIVAGDNDRKAFDADALASLAESIREHGLAQPITVRPVVREELRHYSDGDSIAVGTTYVIVAGERRYRAHRLLVEQGHGAFATIECQVREMTDEQASAVMLAENTARVDLGPLEEASAYRARMDRHGWTAAAVARAAGVSADRVRRRVGLLGLGELARHWLATGQLPIGHAEAMVGLDVNRQRLALMAHEGGPLSGAAMASICRRLRGEQDSESMFDADAFLRVEEYVVAAQAEVAPKVAERVALVGIPEVAEMLGVKRETVDKWRRRGVLPVPGWVVGGSPVWEAGVIVAWAVATGRAAA
ncbi:MAG TPA: ParB/RepB/Spo0J family partition protein [Acidimicrobiales bacterium]